MTTAFYTHPDCLEHITQPGHPERVDRLVTLMDGFSSEAFSALKRCEPALADLEMITRVHPETYVKEIQNASEGASEGYVKLDADTAVVSGSWKAALRAAGALVNAVDLVMSAGATNAFCAVRPPGHHAETAQAMGFCLFNNVAIGAAHALAVHGLSRVAILDFDVHHGNGTQEIFQSDPRVFFASSHQMPLYPGSGAASETGVGNIHNLPLAPDAPAADFRDAWTKLLPELEAFAPEFIFISAGFDAHKADPLSNQNLTDADFVWITEELANIAARCCANRVVSTLEGGYDLDALRSSALAHVKVLMRVSETETENAKPSDWSSAHD
ncbi:MAG: histone deacetylase family protein [Alphaproteobacteria bacterium]|nr:MAG: histone deacetylase family protein [Alphaproteobacteria bacterium]